MKTIIQTPTCDLVKSLEYYVKLGFKVVSTENPIIVTDGRAIIEINPDRFARAGLKCYAQDWKPVVQELNKLTHVISIEHGYMLTDPSGMWIYLLESEFEAVVELEEASYSTLGKFAGLSLETIDMKTSADIFTLLGFKTTMGGLEDGWMTLVSEDQSGVSLMKPNTCPHLFFNPSLTYFNGSKNEEIIGQIRALGIPIAEEITHFNPKDEVDNIIIRDPGGLGCFLFND